MDAPMLSEISHTKKDNYGMILLTCRIQKTNIINRLIETENKLVVTKRGKGGEISVIEVEIKRDKLPVLNLMS